MKKPYEIKNPKDVEEEFYENRRVNHG